jgi:K+-sensing histidine kinase KdpD
MVLAPDAVNRNISATSGKNHVSAGSDVLHLLIPIKTPPDVIFGARYANKLLASQQCVKVSVVHVIKPQRNETLFHSFSSGIDLIAEEHAEAVLREAALHLNEYRIAHRTYIVCGDVMFAILDSAELLNCNQIILPTAKSHSWLKPFSRDIAGSILHSARNVPVILVDRDGQAASAGKSLISRK